VELAIGAAMMRDLVKELVGSGFIAGESRQERGPWPVDSRPLRAAFRTASVDTARILCTRPRRGDLLL